MDLHFNSVKKANRKFYSLCKRQQCLGNMVLFTNGIKEKHQKVGILQGAP